MRRVLIVTYDFPPSSLGIWRTLKFCKYMGEFGWQPEILTVKPVRSPRTDFRPLEELPEGTPIHRTGSLDPFRLAWVAGEWKEKLRGKTDDGEGPRVHKRPVSKRKRAVMDVLRSWLLIPDDKAGWLPFARSAGRRLLREREYDAIYSTSFPNTGHLAGVALAERSDLPYVADFRDIWVGNYYFYHPATKFHDRLQRRAEARVVHRAQKVISATDPITQDFFNRYPSEPREKFLTITNGYDPPDFESGEPQPDHDHYTITYAGTMYGSTSPESFFEGVRILLEREPKWRDVLRLRFIGSMIEPYREMIDEKGLGPISHVDNYLFHDEALRVMKEADALLLLIAPVPGSHIMLTQKVFEYAAARRPIFAQIPDGAAKDFLSDIREGIVVPPGNSQAVAAELEKLLIEFEESGRRELAENPRLNKYQRRELTRGLCGALDEATDLLKR